MRCLVIGAWCLALAGLSAALVGCGTDYCWRSSVPEEVRTVSVPTFRNESDVAELGALSARQVLREFQREGTFRIRATGDAALEIQGVIKSASARLGAYDRRASSRRGAFTLDAVAVVSVIDKRTRKVLVDNRLFAASASFTSGQDLTAARRDASGRLAEDLARQVVDCVLGLKW